MKRRLYQISTILLLAVFCFYNTPRDFVHLFTGHEDTLDETEQSVPTDGLTISDEHRHCEWLHWDVAVYLGADDITIHAVSYLYGTLTESLPVRTYKANPRYCSLRAPPASLFV